MHVAVIGTSHLNVPHPSQHSHAALTQRGAANLAWRKHESETEPRVFHREECSVTEHGPNDIQG